MENIQKTLETLSLTLKQMDSDSIQTVSTQTEKDNLNKLSLLIFDYETTLKLEEYIVKNHLNNFKNYDSLKTFAFENLEKLTLKILEIIFKDTEIKEINKDKYPILKDVHFIFFFEKIISKTSVELLEYVGNNNNLLKNEKLKDLFIKHLHKCDNVIKLIITDFNILLLLNTSNVEVNINRKLTETEIIRLIDLKNVILLGKLIDNKSITITVKMCIHVNHTLNKEVLDLFSTKVPKIFNWVGNDFLDNIDQDFEENKEKYIQVGEYISYMLDKYKTNIESDRSYCHYTVNMLALLLDDNELLRKNIQITLPKTTCIKVSLKAVLNGCLKYFSIEKACTAIITISRICKELEIDFDWSNLSFN